MQPFNKTGRKIVVFSILIIGLLGSVSAAEVNLDQNTFWVNEDSKVTGTYTCNNIGTVKVSKNTNSMQTTDSSFSFETSELVDLAGHGSYDVSLTCDDNSTASNSFKIKELTINWANPDTSKTVYQGRDFKAEISAQIESDNDNPETLEGSSFESEFLDYGSISSDSVSTNGDNTIVKYEVPEESDDLEPGKKTLITTVEYDAGGRDVTAETDNILEVFVQSAWKADILNKTPNNGKISYQKLSKNVDAMSVEAKITEKGEPRNKLRSSDFYVTITKDNSTTVKDEAEWIDRELIGDGTYRLTLTGLPTNLGLGSYNFDIGLDKDGGTSVTEFTVNRYITLTGKITDAKGAPVNANIQATKDGFANSFQMGNQGEYEGQLLPGNYNFTVNFPEVSARFDGVNLREGVQGAIRYDEIPIGDLKGQVDGVTVVNALGITFGYPFESSELEMNYDPSRVNFERVRVLECKGWNLEKRSCSNEWSSLDLDGSQVYPTVGRVVFDANPVNISEGRKKMLNAYMVVRNTQLIPESLNLEKRRVPVGSTVPVSGKIKTPNQNTVGDVEVTISVVKNDETVLEHTATTDSNGVFGAQVPVPEKQGTYYIEVEAKEEPYIGFKERLDRSFATYIERGVNIQVPDTVEFYPGEEAETRFTIINTGQAPLENVVFRVDGLENTWYEFNQESWDRIGPGGSREAVMTTTLPDDYCGETCKQYPKFNVEAVGNSGGESINNIKTVQTVVTKEKEVESQNASSTNNRRSSGAGAIDRQIQATGDFLASQSSLNIALGLITVFLVSLAAAVKKKSTEGERNKRNAISSGSGGRGGSTNTQSRVQRPKVTSDDKEAKEKESADKEESAEEEQESDDSVEEENFVCEECGEEFDSEAALELHKDINQG